MRSHWIVALVLALAVACSREERATPVAPPPATPPPAPAVAPPPPLIPLTPDRMCRDHGELVLERDQECRPLECHATGSADGTIAVLFGKRDERPCKDSGLVTTRCALPTGSLVSINGGAATSLPGDGRCTGPHAFQGTLRSSATTGLWPDRVRLERGALVFEKDCGCGDVLRCEIRASAPDTLAIALSLDPMRAGGCTACYAMVPARCQLPRRMGPLHVAINGGDAFELPADAGDGSLWVPLGTHR